METLRFTIPEIFSLFGVAQCVYIMVYMTFRSGRLSRGTLPLIYFFVLALAFFLDAASRHIGEISSLYDHARWALWFFGPPLSVLLIIQIAQISKTPAWKHYWVLSLIPLAYGVSHKLASPENLPDILIAAGLIAGGISLLAIWFNRPLWKNLSSQKQAKDRYWLILALIVANCAFLATMLTDISLSEFSHAPLIRTILGIGFVYLINTSLFRIYPQAVELIDRRNANRLSEGEYAVAKTIQHLLQMDKVYQEQSYSRADLAKECGVSEATISRVINTHFQKSFPQLMNEHKVEDAKQLLRETGAPIKHIAEDVGFNALASFNRVFKEITGDSPSQFRKKTNTSS